MRFYKQNLHNWAIGESPLYITGISGSGKTTLAKMMADNENEIFHIDSIFAFARFTKEEVIQRYAHYEPDLNKIFIEFVQNTSDKYFLYRSMNNDQEVCENSLFLYHEFMKLWNESNLHNHRYIIEGFPIYLDDAEYYKNKPMIILTEPYIKCAFRVYNRDKNSKAANSKYMTVNWKRVLFKKRILTMFSKKNIHFRQLKIFKSFLNQIKKGDK